MSGRGSYIDPTSSTADEGLVIHCWDESKRLGPLLHASVPHTLQGPVAVEMLGAGVGQFVVDRSKLDDDSAFWCVLHHTIPLRASRWYSKLMLTFVIAFPIHRTERPLMPGVAAVTEGPIGSIPYNDYPSRAGCTWTAHASKEYRHVIKHTQHCW
jgi:hypothetical protein